MKRLAEQEIRAFIAEQERDPVWSTDFADAADHWAACRELLILRAALGGLVEAHDRVARLPADDVETWGERAAATEGMADAWATGRAALEGDV